MEINNLRVKSIYIKFKEEFIQYNSLFLEDEKITINKYGIWVYFKNENRFYFPMKNIEKFSIEYENKKPKKGKK